MKNKRKRIVLVLVIVLTFSLAVTGLTAGGYGGTMDLDGDNRITIHDAQLAREAEGGLRKLTDAQLFAKSDYRSEEIIDKLYGGKQDDRMNILLIGNSFSCGFCEELTGMLNVAGIKARVYSVYFPACTAVQHWEWTEANEAHYRLRHYLQTGGYVTNGYEAKVDGVSTILDPVSLEYCLAAEEDWDVIALQTHFMPVDAKNYENTLTNTAPAAKNMYEYLRGKYPNAKLCWFETWIFDIGYPHSSLITDLDAQNKLQDNVRIVSTEIAEENSVSMIPCGGAWKIARNEYDLGELTRGDTVHDGYANGGQYLNACVWFECLTGQSCVGNTYRPTEYTLDDTNSRIQTLQQIAHRAVEENPIETDHVVE